MKNLYRLLFIVFGLISMNTTTFANSREMQFKTWKTTTRSDIRNNPIDAVIEDNSYILIRFIEQENQPIYLQIKDNYGNIIFQEMVLPNEQTDYKVDLNGFKKGEYELIYQNEYTEIDGNFYIE